MLCLSRNNAESILLLSCNKSRTNLDSETTYMQSENMVSFLVIFVYLSLLPVAHLSDASPPSNPKDG